MGSDMENNIVGQKIMDIFLIGFAVGGVATLIMVLWLDGEE